MQRRLIKVTAFICVGLFVYFMIRANPRELLRIVGRLSPLGIVLLVTLRVLFWAIRTWSWQIVLACCSPERPRFSTLFGAELAGHAVGHFTPSAKLGGDAIRAVMLTAVPKNKALASVVLDKSIELMATVLMMSLGLLIALLRIRMAPAQRAVFLFLTAAAAVSIYVFFRRQKKGLFVWILNVLDKLHIRIKYLEGKKERLAEADAVIVDFYSRRRRAFLGVFSLYVAMILLWAVEIHLTFMLIGWRGITPLTSFLVTALGILANIVPVVPAGIGIYEMVNLSVFAILRIPQPAGIAVILLRRLLNLLMAVVGLLPMLRLRSQRKPAAPYRG